MDLVGRIKQNTTAWGLYLYTKPGVFCRWSRRRPSNVRRVSHLLVQENSTRYLQPGFELKVLAILTRTWCRYNQIYTFGKLLSLSSPVNIDLATWSKGSRPRCQIYLFAPPMTIPYAGKISVKQWPPQKNTTHFGCVLASIPLRLRISVRQAPESG